MILLPIDPPQNCMECPCSHYNPMLFSVHCQVLGRKVDEKPDDCPMEVIDGESN